MSEIKRHQNAPIWREIDALRYQSVGQLRIKYLEVFRQESRSNHKQFLVRRIAWRLQANAEGDLSERARQRAVLVAEEADLRIRAPQSFLKELKRGNRDPRLPAVGARSTVNSKDKASRWMCWRRGFAIKTKSIDRSVPWRDM